MINFASYYTANGNLYSERYRDGVLRKSKPRKLIIDQSTIITMDTDGVVVSDPSRVVLLNDFEDIPPMTLPARTWPSNCKNCGAPLHSNKCEYCDTEY